MFFYFTFDECTPLELLDISGWILDGCNEKWLIVAGHLIHRLLGNIPLVRVYIAAMKF